MTIDVPNHPMLHDRRAQAADEMRGVQGEYIYGTGTRARRASESAAGQHGFNAARIGGNRTASRIVTVILHLTGGHTEPGNEPPPGDAVTDAYLDHINAHFVVLNNGNIYYLRDLSHTLNNCGGGTGIDIEFAGRFGLTRGRRPAPDPEDSAGRLSPTAIRSARLLLVRLRAAVPSIGYIHPHGQFQRNKHDTCCGPDVWMNVGEWAAENLHLRTDTPSRFHAHAYTDLGISGQQRNYAYLREGLA